MAFTHTTPTEAELGPAVWKLVRPEAPAQLRGMAARGLAPLAPRDLVCAFYWFWSTNDAELSAPAVATVEGLPLPLVHGALGDRNLPAGVLDFLARKLLRKTERLDAIVRHANVHDETLAVVARYCPETVCETLAENQTRWLRWPAIVEGLYHNPNCRMSLIHRVLELAEREHVELRLPAMEEIRQALAQEGPPDPTRDAAFQANMRASAGEQLDRDIHRHSQAAVDEHVDDTQPNEGEQSDELAGAVDSILGAFGSLDELSLPLEDTGNETQQPSADAAESEQALPVAAEKRIFQISHMTIMEKIRLALLGGQFERAVLVRDSSRSVAMAAVKSPKVRETEVVAYAANRSLAHEIIRYIANRREWIKLYAVKLNLVMNPKTPMALAMTFLGHLHPHDVKKVSHSKNIPSALATAAKRKLQSNK